MLRTREWVIYSLLAAMGLSLPLSVSQAGLFDFSSTKRPAPGTKRGQSPDPEFYGPGAAMSGWQPGGNDVDYDESCDDFHVPGGWGYDSSPCFWPSEQGLFGCRTWNWCTTPGCFNCGQNDHGICCTKFHRYKCGQTWYPRLAPYCKKDWGWTQPCWRRAPDNYNCLRPEAPATKSQRRGPQVPLPPPTAPPTNLPPPPAAEPLSPPPPPPATTSFFSPISRTSVVSRTTASPPSEKPVAARIATVAQPAPPRITASGYTYKPQRPSAVGEPLDTLERRMEAEQTEFADENDDADDESLDD